MKGPPVLGVIIGCLRLELEKSSVVSVLPCVISVFLVHLHVFS